MFAHPNLNIGNSVPHLITQAKYGKFQSASLSTVKKMSELDRLCSELIPVGQFVKVLKCDKFLQVLTDLRLDLKYKVFKFTLGKDQFYKLPKAKDRLRSSQCTKYKEAVVTGASCASDFNQNSDNFISHKHLNHDAHTNSCNNNVVFEQMEVKRNVFRSDVSVNHAEKRWLPSAIREVLTFRDLSNGRGTLMYGTLHMSPGLRLKLSGSDGCLQVQARGFRVRRQGTVKVSESIWKKFVDDTSDEKSQDSKKQESENVDKNATFFKWFNLRRATDIARFLMFSIGAFFLIDSYRTVFKTDKFGRSHISEVVSETFADVIGAEEAKQELKCIVEFLRNPEQFNYLGGKLPRGVLLQGPPGTGKTLLARAVAGEAGVEFFHANASEFDEILVGEGARRVRSLFTAARSRAPAVIFIDEIDAVGGKRSSNAWHPFANQTIVQLLTEMDGFVRSDRIIVIGATNREADLDEALLRPGRFDIKVKMFKPNVMERKDMLNYYLGKVISKDVDVENLAKQTLGFSGADLENLVNQAALFAAVDGKDSITMPDMEKAMDKVLLGPEIKSFVRDEKMMRMVAYHESGHAVVAYYTRGCKLPIKATVLPRGDSLGHVRYASEDKLNQSKQELLGMIDSSLGGRVAEELVFGADKVTSGCHSDLQTATDTAALMVRQLGMSEKIGLRTLRQPNSRSDDSGSAVNDEADAEIKRIIQESHERTRKLLKKHMRELKLLAETLLERETLNADEMREILGKREVEDIAGKEEAVAFN